MDFGSTWILNYGPPYLLPHALTGLRSLKNHGVDAEAERMFVMGAETMSLPLSEKMQFEQGDKGVSFGYKASGANAVDEFGNRDTVEFINVSQDDALAWPQTVHRTYPRTVVKRMDDTIIPFVKKSRAVNMELLRVLEMKLGIPQGELSEKHSEELTSGSETRCIKNPPRPPGEENRTAIGAHSDFGSLVGTTISHHDHLFNDTQSFLHNRLGGLQVMVPGTEEWQYVKVMSLKPGMFSV